MPGIAESVYYGFTRRRIASQIGIASIERRPDLTRCTGLAGPRVQSVEGPEARANALLVQVARLHDVCCGQLRCHLD